MTLAPFGTLTKDHQDAVQKQGLFDPMESWPKSESYRELLDKWLKEVADAIWPAWTNGAWVGDSASDMEVATKAELELAVRLYHGGAKEPDILKGVPDVPKPSEGVPRDHEWHFGVEDARMFHHIYSLVKAPELLTSYEHKVSKNGWANHHIYDPTFDPGDFEKLFLGGFRKHAPSLYGIKNYFQRPRPWTAALGLNVTGFRWNTGGRFIHTGIHPSLLSGHCIQGILGGCNVIEGLLTEGKSVNADSIRAIQKYMVDWGDRRVFAGVHYMTDNISSWTLARRLIPHLFQNVEVENLAFQAITQHSRVFGDIVSHFPEDNPARTMLLADFPEASTS